MEVGFEPLTSLSGVRSTNPTSRSGVRSTNLTSRSGVQSTTTEAQPPPPPFLLCENYHTHEAFTVDTVTFLPKLLWVLYKLSLVMRKPDFCICENKDADQLRSNCAADQRLCFHYTDSTIPLLPKSKTSSL